MMSDTLSLNTKAILLLTSPLLVSRRGTSADILKPSEYKRLARRLREVGAEPADFFGASANQLAIDCQEIVERTRLDLLLGRGFLLSQALQRWNARGIWALSRADEAYPRRLKARLKEDSPPILYGSGNQSLLDRGGLAVVGSRNIEDDLRKFAQDIGRLTANAGHTLISGGAKGSDQAAMWGALESLGGVVGVLADGLERKVLEQDYRIMLQKDRLALLSVSDPSAGFSVGIAMQRNKLIYALSDAALIVNADREKGGTWAGAIEQLRKFHFVPVYVRITGRPSTGLKALMQQGAFAWPISSSIETVRVAVTASAQTEHGPNRSGILFHSKGSEETSGASTIANLSAHHRSEALISAELPSGNQTEDTFAVRRTQILKLAQAPVKVVDVAQHLSVSESTARKLLNRLVDEEDLARSGRPARYILRQVGLFETAESGNNRLVNRSTPSTR